MNWINVSEIIVLTEKAVDGYCSAMDCEGFCGSGTCELYDHKSGECRRNLVKSYLAHLEEMHSYGEFS